MSELTTEERLQRIEEELGIEDSDDDTDDLPSFGDCDMEEHFGPENARGDVYVDGGGHIWVDTDSRNSNLPLTRENNEQVCFGDYEDEFFEALEAARDYAAEQ